MKLFGKTREEILTAMQDDFDVVVIGGGITGAGILREATRQGLKTLLVEGHDFSSGTSSRSSKLVHGGLRYLNNKQYDVTYESVTEREFLLKQAPGLVDRAEFAYVANQDDKTPGWKFGLGILIYGAMAKKFILRHMSREKMMQRFPLLSSPKLAGGFGYYDSFVDDSRLVLRVIQEAVADGGVAINYMMVRDLLKDADGKVIGVRVEDQTSDGEKATLEIRAKVVVSATGPWTDDIRAMMGQEKKIRPLIGSHIIVHRERFPIDTSFALVHPDDNRAMFILPWENVTMVGTTDLDVGDQIELDPSISADEVTYCLRLVNYNFPEVNLTKEDVITAFAGIRPIIDTGAPTPSQESRAHKIFEDAGLIQIAGGKLTTFRIMAKEVMEKVAAQLGREYVFDKKVGMLNAMPNTKKGFSKELSRRLYGRYGKEAEAIFAMDAVQEPFADAPYSKAEVVHAVQNEGVVHLEDLMLRRLRFGLLVKEGGKAHLDEIRKLATPYLDWDENRWQSEISAYNELWARAYRVK
jgi:glycerol-3-phosphate dehydrogenase